MGFGLRVLSAPIEEPVSVTEVKLHTRIDSSVDDSLIEMWIRAARQIAEGYQRRAYISQTIQLSFDEFPAYALWIPRAPLVGVESMSYVGTDNVEVEFYHDPSVQPASSTTPEPDAQPAIGLDDYIVDIIHEPGRVCPSYGKLWPSVILAPMAGFRVTLLAGYGDPSDVPDTVKDAICLYCAYRYENRTAESGEAPKQFYDLLTPDRMWHP